MDPIRIGLTATVLVTLVASIAVVRRVHGGEQRWRDVLCERFVMGVPWGSLLVIGFVLLVYLFVQNGLSDFQNPVTIPFRAWSYYYPFGIAIAPFSHASSSHLIGNLLGTAVVAPIAEYAWGHYPDEADDESASAWRTVPWVRAFVLFPAAAIGVGLVTGLFALGPIIGFSGVVFAFIGFAIVRYPIVTIVAVLGGHGALATIYRALQSPIAVYVAQPRPPAPPSWASIAIQGHALGFLLGFVLGIALIERRGYRPNPVHLWLAVLLFAFSKALWAIYWFGGTQEYILFQGPGVALVTVLALVLTLAVTASRQPLAPLVANWSRTSRDHSGDPPPSVTRIVDLALTGRTPRKRRFDRVRELALGGRDQWSRQSRSTASDRLSSITRRQSAFVVVLVVLAIISGPAIPVNLFVLEGDTTSSQAAIEVDGYVVEYAEDVDNELASVVDVGSSGPETSIVSSGVIVSSPDRNIWMEAVSEQRLAFSGEETIYVGGPGWREAVHVERTGWEPVGNETVYQVWLWEDGGERELAYTSDPTSADVRIEGSSVRIVSDDRTFHLEVQTGDEPSVSSTPIPEDGESIAAGEFVFERDDGTVYAVSGETRVPIATEETYN